MFAKKVTSNSVDLLLTWGNCKITVDRIDARAEVTEVTCTTVANEDSDTYFVLEDGENNFYYVWLNVGDTGTDPAPNDDWTGVEVTTTDADTNADVAADVVTAVDALDAFSASNTNEVVTITNATAGATTEGARDVDTGFTVSVDTAGLDAYTTMKEEIPWDDVTDIYDLDLQDNASADLYATVRTYKETKDSSGLDTVVTREYYTEYRTESDWFSPA